MPRRKRKTYGIKELQCHDMLIRELSQRPELANFDMSSIELTIKENKLAPRIVKKDIDTLVDRLQRSYSANKCYVETFEGRILASNVDLARWMKVTLYTVNKWIKDGLIKAHEDRSVPVVYFDVDEVVEQLRLQRH